MMSDVRTKHTIHCSHSFYSGLLSHTQHPISKIPLQSVVVFFNFYYMTYELLMLL